MSDYCCTYFFFLEFIPRGRVTKPSKLFVFFFPPNSLLGSSQVARQVKGLVLSLPWQEFDPWPGNFLMLRVWPKTSEQ